MLIGGIVDTTSLIARRLLVNEFDHRLFVAIVVSGIFGIIGLYFFSIKRYGVWRK